MPADYVITITREFGSMGRSIAKRLSEMLEIDFYDRDIVEEVAKKLDMPVSRISGAEEKARSGLFYRRFPLGTEESYIQDMIFDVQKEIILDLASKSSCILVGRCADSLTAHMQRRLSISVYAPFSERLKNCVEKLSMTAEEAERMINSVDRARRAYHKKYAGYFPNDEKHMDVMINSSFLGVEGTAEILADMAGKKFGLYR